MNNIQVKIEELNALPATKIVENANVQAKFVQLYNSIHGTEKGASILQKEVFNFQKMLDEKPDLANCSRMSLLGCFLDMAVNGLSLDPTGRQHCYIIPRSVKAKDGNGKEFYEKRAAVSVTGYGEIVMRQRAGQIKHVDNPVIVYEGDTFAISLDKGQKLITYAAAIPRKSKKIVGAFIHITRLDGSEDYSWLLEGDIDRLKWYSSQNNKKWDDKEHKYVAGDPNSLYVSNGGGIDSGFLEAKMIKHAFDAYPKVRTGAFTVLETEEEQNAIDYGIEDAEVIEETPAPQAFGAEKETRKEPAGITVSVTKDDEEVGF
jgi:recombinational DNA repair protein RecT